MNNITILGNLGQKAEVKTLPSGDKVANFSVGTASGFGENKSTIWFSCSCFGKQAEVIEKFTDKGSKVLLIGRLEERSFTTKDGIQKTSFNLVVGSINLLDSAPKADKPANAPNQNLTSGVPIGKPAQPNFAPMVDNSDPFGNNEDTLPF
jgi:single-strand DNA-binding protein